MFDIFCCVGFDSLFFVKTVEKHPRFYIKIFCFLNIKKARKHGLFKVSIHLVSPIWLRETATYFSHDTFQIFILFSTIEKKSAASNHSETAELLSDILSPTATYLLYDTLCVSPIFFRYQRLIVALI